MGAFLIPGIIAGAQTAFGIGQKIAGGVQRRRAQKFFEKNKYEIPSGVRSSLDVVRNVASQRNLPGSEQYLNQIRGATSQSVETATRAAQSTSDVLGALQGSISRQMGAQQDLAIASAQNWQRNQFQYANSLENLARYETEKYDRNIMYPYMQRMEAAGQTSQAGNENIASGISSGLNLWGANQQMKADEANLAEFMRQKQSNFPTTYPFKTSPVASNIPQPRPYIPAKNFSDYNNPNPIPQYGGLEPSGEGNWSPYQ